MLLAHIISAMASLIVSGVAMFRPSRSGLIAGYCLAAATVASGTYLIVCDSAHILSACLSGLMYLSLVSLMIGRSRHALAANKIKEE